ncbi:MAG: acyl-CoA dehydratase activase [Desulfosoma sp.]
MNPTWRRLRARMLTKAWILETRLNRFQEHPLTLPFKEKTARVLLDAYGNRRVSILSGFLVPAELLHAYETAPMFTENLGAILAGAGYGGRCLQTAEMHGYSPDVCSFHRATLGGVLAGYLPRFQLVVATSHVCDGQSKTLEEIARLLEAEFFLLDVPQENTPEAVHYLAEQLRRLEAVLQDLTGMQLDAERWRKIFAWSHETREMQLRLQQIRRRRPCPLYGREAFILNFLTMQLMGTRFLRDAYRRLLHTLESGKWTPPDGERFRIVWLLAYPFFKDSFVPFMEKELGMRAVAEELGFVFEPFLDGADPHKSLAQKMLSNPNLGPIENRIRLVESLVREYEPDGVVHFSHWGCRQGCGGVSMIADALARLGVPFLELHGDCVDDRNDAPGAVRTRLEGFAEVMGKRRAQVSVRPVDGFYLGIDVGSLTAKAVVINGSGEIQFHKVIYTGASCKRAARQLYEMLLEHADLKGKIRACVATGYGRSVIDFADATVSEISCHARGMVHQIKEVRTIIDIGGQDTKAISVDEDGTVRQFLMNDKCAAGTGRFLEVMARALEIDLEDLGPLACRARRSLTISSTCAVFAESEVVSLIADDTPPEEIARGICDSIAARTAAMVARVGKRERVAMSGGVAKNIGMVRALERALQTSLVVPPEPQIIGALGAALLARDRCLGLSLNRAA